MKRESVRVLRSLAWGVLGLCGACTSDALEDADPVEESQAELNGLATFPDLSCSGTEDRIRQAVSLAHSRIHDARMLPCLKNSMLIWPGFAYPEMILSKMTQEQPTAVRCVDGDMSWACGGQTEEICLTKNLVNGSVAPYGSLAAVILHEIAHIRGYNHPGYYGQSPNDQLASCTGSMNSGDTQAHGFGVQRSAYKYETELASVGGLDMADGSYFYAGCTSTGFAGGWDVRTGTNLSGLRLRCRSAAGTESVMPWQPSSSAGTLTTQNCTTSELMVGIHGKANAGINGVGVVCQSRSTIDQKSTSGRRNIAAAGGSTGLTFERTCPAGMAVRSIRGRLASASPSSILRLRLMCENPNAAVTELPTLVARLGQASPAWHDSHACADHGAMRGLTSSTIPSQGLFPLLYGHCTATETVFTSSNTVDKVQERAPSSRTWLQGEASSYAVPESVAKAENYCASGSALVGLKGFVKNNFIAGLQGICAPITTWSDLDLQPAPTKTYLDVHGTSTGATSAEALCGRGAFISELDVGRDNTTNVSLASIRSVAVLCKKLSYLRP